MKIYSSHNRYAKTRSSYYKKPFHKTRGFYFLIIIILAISTFVYFSIRNTPAEDPQNQKFTDQDNLPINYAKVLSTEGKVEVKAPEENWEEIGSGYKISTGSYVQTSSASKVVIELPDKSVMRVKENTELVIEQMGMADIIIEQKSGTIFHRVNDSSTAIYRVKNGFTELTALGTGFNVFTSSQLTKVTVTESKVKAKIYDAEENIINMRTIESGTMATINPDLALESMIQTDDVKSDELLKDEWYVWNLEQDRENKFFLGIFEETVKLVITEPALAEMSVDTNEITIKGSTDPDAEVFMSGKELDNNNGQFETEYLLGTGENKIEITAKVGKNQNTRTLIITSTKQADNIKLTGTTTDSKVDLTWKPENLSSFSNFIVLKGTEKNPTYPESPFHKVDQSTFSDSWQNLEDDTYYFRVCTLNTENKCTVYSDNYETTIGKSTTVSGTIILTSSSDNDKINLNWDLSSDLKPTEGFKTMISQASNPTYPGNSYHSLANNARSDTWTKLSSDIYHFRVCLLKDDQCLIYSNDAQVTLTTVQLEQTGSIQLIGTANGSQIDLSWETIGVPLQEGFRTIVNTSGGVNFPGNNHHLVTSNSATSDIWTDLTSGQTYYFKVCQNTGSGCGVYSNEISITY